MRRWIPHIHRGETTTECTAEDGMCGGREGYYLNICWLGWMIEISLSSARWERQWFARHAE
jgi:hypothetical protein